MDKEENIGRESGTKNELSVKFANCASFSVVHFHIVGYPSKFMVFRWAGYYPVAQIEAEG